MFCVTYVVDCVDERRHVTPDECSFSDEGCCGPGILDQVALESAASSAHRHDRRAIEAVVSGDCGSECAGFLPESFLGVRRRSSGGVRHLQDQENQTMLQRDCQRVVLVGALALLLSACGGGLNSILDLATGNGTTDKGTFQVNAAQARALTGAGEPDFADGDVATALEGLTVSSDALLMSDFRTNLADGTLVPLATICSGATCNAPAASALLGSELSISVSDLSYVDADGDGDARFEAVGSHHGVSLAQGSGVSTFSGVAIARYGYGGWMDHSFFVVESGTISEGPAVLEGAGVLFSYSLGAAADSNPSLTGSGTWTGVMVGMDSMADGNPVQGDARITVDDFSDPMVDVAFTNVLNLVAGTAYQDMSWTGMVSTDGGFQGGAGTRTIQGQFYGPSHQEVGGTFMHDSILGAFGASR